MPVFVFSDATRSLVWERHPTLRIVSGVRHLMILLEIRGPIGFIYVP